MAVPAKPNEDEAAVELADQLPRWFVSVYAGSEHRGFFRRLAHHTLAMQARNSDTLVVTFDNLSNVDDASPERVPWAHKFLDDEGHAHLGVMAHRKDWYREPGLIAALEELAADGLFTRYKRVIFAGTSMGGFGALAFSSLAPGAHVLAFSPQSTLDETTVPWETRFGMGRLRNWRLAYSDTAFEIETAGRVVVISDPYMAPDQRHVDRLRTGNILKLKAWYSGHFTPVFLRRAELLKPIMSAMIDGSLDEALFYQLYRQRRRLPWYRKALETAMSDRGRPQLAKRVRVAFRKAARADQPTDEKPECHELNGVRLPADRAIINPPVAKALRRGNYEQRATDALPVFLTQEDRVLELGAGIGYVSSLVAASVGVAHITSVEANADLATYIEKAHQFQGLHNTQVRNCAVVSAQTTDTSANFYIRDPFWSSSLDPGRDPVEVRVVPAVPISTLIKETDATALIVSIEGGERDLFEGADLGRVNKIYVELHTRYIRPKGIKACFDALSELGFYYDQRLSMQGAVLFRRLLVPSKE